MDIEVSTRAAATDGLVELAASDPRVVLICMDSLSTMKGERFAEAYPTRTFDVGIAEQHAMAFASGLASCGLRPWVAAFAGFITMRACEEVRTFVAYPGLNVKMVGANGGLAGGGRDGATHQFTEDLAILRAIPRMTIVAPADAGQVRQAVLALGEVDGPAYVRVGSGRDPVVYPPTEPFELGRIHIVERLGDDVALFANGYLLKRTIEAAHDLAGAGIRATVVDVHTLKPLDVEGISAILGRTRAAVTVEDHNIFGGLGSAIAEVIAEHAPSTLVRVGIRDVFAESGPAGPLLDKYGMSVGDIVAAGCTAVATRREHGIGAATS